jgi:hypothetical protein
MLMVDKVATSLDSIEEPAPMMMAVDMMLMLIPYKKLPLRNSRETTEIVKGEQLPPQAA